jgi:dihydroorotase
VLACLAGLADGTVDAIANGISGIETALGLVLEAVAAGRVSLTRVVEALTVGPARVLGTRLPVAVGLVEGELADLVVFDAAERWDVSADGLRSLGKNSPLVGRSLPGRVLLTVAVGRVAYADEAE